MQRKQRWKRIAYIALAGLGIFVVVGVILAGRNAPLNAPVTPPMQLLGGHVVGNRISTRSWSFDYRHTELSPDGTYGTIDGVRNGVIFRKGKPYLNIAAEHISVNTNTLDFTATGRVHVESFKAGQVRSYDTDLVTWTNGSHLLELRHPTYIRSNGQVLKVENITVDFTAQSIRLGKIDGNVVIGR